MEVNNNELREFVFKYLYLPAMESIYEKGRYWFNASQSAAYILI